MNLKPEKPMTQRGPTVLFPFFLKLEGRRVLIVGGGKVAEEKLDAMLRSAGDVTVIAPHIRPRIAEWARQSRVKHIAAEYWEGAARDFFLVITCTDSEFVNRKIYEECRRAGILCNAVDDPNYCDFYAAAVVRRGELQIAISTGGNSPALAQRIRRKLEREFGPEYGPWTGWLGRMRTALREALPRNEHTKELLHLLAECGPEKFVNRHEETRR
jgi:precorrin-2 dehydrogenase/sirohydrochlorin ferrochelatase